MVDVTDCKQNINKHLTSAQQWLSEAEEAFEKDSDIRGELNLFLAQAELTRAKETNRSQHWRHRYSVFRHSIAIGLAFVIAAGGMTASYLWATGPHGAKQPLPTSAPAPVYQTRASQVDEFSGVMTTTSSPQTVVPESNAYKAVAEKDRTTASPQLSAPPAADKQSHPSTNLKQEQALPLTPDEVDNLIRLAGKSLRGQ